MMSQTSVKREPMISIALHDIIESKKFVKKEPSQLSLRSSGDHKF